MDWDWNDFAWDSIEWEEKEDNSTLAGLVGPGSLGGQNNNSSSRGGIMVDLKLRGISDLEERSADGLEYRGPFKRTRVMSGTQNVSCSVDGCKSDLSICRDYHRRHRVCERHSKTPVVIVGGKEQRFCQQCSRYYIQSMHFIGRQGYNLNSIVGSECRIFFFLRNFCPINWVFFLFCKKKLL